MAGTSGRMGMRGLSKYHTGIFAQNYFQIDSIHSKKLQFWQKIVKIIYFLTLKPILFWRYWKNDRWRHKSEISKRKVKTISTIIPPLGMVWVLKEAVWSTLFQLIFHRILIFFVGFLMSFHFGWKTADQTNKLQFLVHFSGHPRVV